MKNLFPVSCRWGQDATSTHQRLRNESCNLERQSSICSLQGLPTNLQKLTQEKDFGSVTDPHYGSYFKACPRALNSNSCWFFNYRQMGLQLILFLTSPLLLGYEKQDQYEMIRKPKSYFRSSYEYLIHSQRKDSHSHKVVIQVPCFS